MRESSVTVAGTCLGLTTLSMVMRVGVLDGWRFCPRCGGGLAVDPGTVSCAGCGWQTWANSVPGVHALVEREGKVLLGRRAFDPGAGMWGLPGGFLDEGEHPHDGLRRELREETGLDVEPGEYLGAWMQPHGERTVLCLIWSARAVGGLESAADDVLELGWFAPAELPPDIGPDAFAAALSAWRSRHEQP